MYCAIAIVFNAVTMSSSFTLLHLDFISCLLRNKKYNSKFTSLEIFPAYLGYTVKYKFCYSARYKFLGFFIFTAAEGWEEKKIFTKEVCDHQKEREGRRWNIEIYQLKTVILLGNSFAHRQSFWLVSLALPVNHKPNGSISLLLKKSDGWLCWKWNFWFLACVHLPPVFIKADSFFSFWGGVGAGDSWTQFSRVHQNMLRLMHF